MLLFGKQFTKNNPNKIGGVIKLFEIFKDELDNAGIDYDVIDLNWRNYHNLIFAYVYILFCIVYKTPKHRVISFHGTANEFIYLAPFLVFMGHVLTKKVSLRKFAGNFDQVYLNVGFFRKAVIKYTLQHAETVFFETKYLVRFFKKFNKSTYWFPNVRPKQERQSELCYRKRFVFIGHVIKEKGVRELIEVFAALSNEFTLDVYGPIGDGFAVEDFNTSNVSYGGTLASDTVCNTLIYYDALLLPSYREGYPGVIIEALSVGVPVIASELSGIKEMIINLYNGLLIEPENSLSLFDAVKSLDEQKVVKLKLNAVESFKSYDSYTVTRSIINKILH